MCKVTLRHWIRIWQSVAQATNPAPELCFCFNKTLLEHSLSIYISSREAFVLPTDTVYPGNIEVFTIWHSAEKDTMIFYHIFETCLEERISSPHHEKNKFTIMCGDGNY